MESTHNTLFTLDFTLKKIILVNSASHAYSEILLDKPLALFGKNNRGKTSSLAALKLLLYPEDNFKDCAKKFNFTNKQNQPYDKDDSYKHYFPTNNSFIGLEVENHSGTFTMLLHRAADYHYARMFFPCSYEKIKPVIWDDSIGESGYFSENLSIKNLLDLNKQMKGLYVSDKTDLQKMLYGNYASNTSKYCIVPLKDQKESSIKSFVKIFELAFDDGKNEASKLPQAIATIIEMQRGRKEEKLDENVFELKNDRAILEKEGNRIKSLVENKDTYAEINNDFNHIRHDLHETALKVAAFTQALNKAKNEYSSSIGKLLDEKNLIEPKHNRLQETIKNTKTQLHLARTRLDMNEKDLRGSRDKLVSAQSLLGSRNEDNVDSAVMAMRTELKDLNDFIQALENKEDTVKLITKKTNDINRMESEIKRKQAALDNFELLLANQLLPHTANVLGSLSPEFLDFVWGDLLTDDQLQVFTDFASIFDKADDDSLLLMGQELGDKKYIRFDPESQRQSITNYIDKKKKTISSLRHEVSELNKGLVNFGTDEASTKLLDLKKESQALTSNISLLSGMEFIQSQIAEKEKENAEKLAFIDKHQKELEQTQEEAESIANRHNQLLSEISRLREQKNAVDMSNAIAENFQLRGIPYIADDNKDLQEYISKVGDDISVKTATKIASDIQNINTRISKLIKEVEQFSIDVICEDVDPNKAIDSFSELEEVIRAYKDSFDTLEYSRGEFRNAIRTHKSTVDNLLKEISDSADLLQSTISDLNKKLNRHQISNLKRVDLSLNISPDFANLVQTQKKHNSEEDSLLDDSFYESLISFVQKSSYSNSQRLKMINLIESIDYEYTFEAGIKESKSQSGGTTSTITALITTLLFSEAFLEGSKLNMPIVVDEIGTIDKDNIATIVEHVTREGFTVMCANPEFHASTVRHVPRYLQVDQCTIDGSPMASGCIYSLLPSILDFRGEVLESELEGE